LRDCVTARLRLETPSLGLWYLGPSLTGVVCIRLDATVTIAHPDKELAVAGYKGFGLSSAAGGLR
jgi:hypothetical protein